MDYGTEQEAFWAGEFGDEYSSRNDGPAAVAAKTAMFARILSRAGRVRSVVELGANIGLNMLAIRALLPAAELTAVEINETAFKRLKAIAGVNAIYGSIFDADLPVSDLAFTAGVLIHLNPDRLTEAYAKLYESARRYVLVVEYYNPTPVEITYRGHAARLFKRDFAGDLMEHYPDLTLIDYGFIYRRDPIFPADDLTWFLMEKR